ncbi:MAG: efflux RND transporter permease subunit [Proteobacteria bacterium]|nr:efflux RND transporter permease subunit [Pseudomonadota bacterium]
MKTMFLKIIRHTIMANILLVLVFAAGALSVSMMVREDLPDIAMDEISVSVEYPGADPLEVEDGVTRKIEEALEDIEGIKEYNTYSSENFSLAMIQVEESFDSVKVLNRVRSDIGAISTFPPRAEKPVITELLHRLPVMTLYLTGDMTEKRMIEWAKQIKDELRQFPEVGTVEIQGAGDYEIGVEISPERLRRFGITLDDVAQAIQAGNLNLAGGAIRGEKERIRIRTQGRKYTVPELASIVVKADRQGHVITLDRLADIKDGLEEDPVMASVDGTPTILLTIYKNADQDAIRLSERVREYLASTNKHMPPGVRINVLFDNAEALKNRIDLLTKNGLFGLCLVFLLLWMFLDLRLSFWVGLGIPISLAGAMFILYILGGTINMVSIFGFILVLGIVVDDAIVVGEAIYTQRREGLTRHEAALAGVVEVGMPVAIAVATTVVTFVPLLFITGVMGKFISILPVVVIASLVVSLIESMFLLPAHLAHSKGESGINSRPSGRLSALNGFASRGLETAAYRVYGPILKLVLRWRYILVSCFIAILLATVGLLAGGFLKFEELPDTESFVVTAKAQYPDGTPWTVTQKGLEHLEKALDHLNEKVKIPGKELVQHRLRLLGQSPAGDVKMPDTGAQPHIGMVQAVLLDAETRGISTNDIVAMWGEEINGLPGVESLKVEGASEGHPGSPIEIWLLGQDLNTLSKVADELQERLRRFQGVTQTASDLSKNRNELVLRLKNEARSLGLTLDDMARQIFNGYYGLEAVRLQRGRDDVRIKVRYAAEDRTRLTDLQNLHLSLPQGGWVPLKSVADIDMQPAYTTLTRTMGARRVSVTADVDSRRANAAEILSQIQADYLSSLPARFPGVSVSIRGDMKENQETFGSLIVGFPLAIITIYLILATVFRSYWQPLVILATVPFGIVGAILGHLAMGYDLSLMSIFGIVALAGVVVNDAIVLISKYNELRDSGLPPYQAMELAGQRRLRAIILTTISTIGGLAPLIMDRSLEAQMLIPMALSLSGGLAFATLLTLLLIPGQLMILNDLQGLYYGITTRLRKLSTRRPTVAQGNQILTGDRDGH